MRSRQPMARNISPLLISIKISIKISIAILIVLSFSTGCVSVKNLDIDDKFANIKNPEVPPFDATTAIKLYVKALDSGDDRPRSEHKYLVSRLAQLQLSVGEQDLASISATKVRRGRESILSAIKLFKQLLALSEKEADTDKILYLLAKAYTLVGNAGRASNTLGQLINTFPESPYVVEARFRRGEMMFAAGKYKKAENEYLFIVERKSDKYFYDKGLYKLGWAQFKQSNFDHALKNYIKLLTYNEKVANIKESNQYADLNSMQRGLLEDVIKSIGLIYLYQGNTLLNQKELALLANQAYGPMLFREISDIYIQKKMPTSAAQILLDFASNNIYHPLAIRFHSDSIELFERAENIQLEVKVKSKYVKYYGVGSRIWEDLRSEKRTEILPKQIKYVRQLATFYHKRANELKQKNDYLQAVEWYSRYVNSFPTRHDVAQMQFLLSEALYGGKFYQRAIVEYEKTAYQFTVNKNSAEAGYAALLSYAKVLQTVATGDREKWTLSLIKSALQFAKKYHYDKRVPAVLIKTSQSLYDLGKYEQAVKTIKTLISSEKYDSANMKIVAWRILAHSHYSLGVYKTAEADYSYLLSLFSRKHEFYNEISTRVVDSIYKQGEIYRKQGNYQLAAAEFMRVANITADPITRAAAEYDAAAAYLRLQDWNRAIVILASFSEKHPSRKDLVKRAKDKLVFAYSKTGQHIKAANKLMDISESVKSKIRNQDLLWEAAVRFDKGGEIDDAALTYKSYVWKYPLPLDNAMEARLYLSDYYQQKKDDKKYKYWLNQIIANDKKAGKRGTDRSRYLAATAVLKFANMSYKKYQSIVLKEPLKTSMKKKKNAMKKALSNFQKAMAYQVEDIYIAATYQLAELYSDFARSIMAAKKPSGLSELELEQYVILLEEKTYPLEEKAINIHKTNMQFTRDGVFSEGVRKSLHQLSTLEPYRFNKHERVIPYVDANY